MDLVQRDEQLAQLRAAFVACKEQRRGHVVLVSGAVGSGKTGFLEAFIECVTSDGGQVLNATGSWAEHTIHLGVLSQLFLAPGFAPELSGRFESLMRDAAHVSPPRTGGPTPAWASLLHGLFTSLVETTGRSPLVLAVDDVHYADVASLHCLLYVVRRLRRYRIMVVLTESSMLRPPHSQFRAELLSQPHLTRAMLQPLGADALAWMIGDGLDAATARQLTERCVALTGGSPLLARALISEPAFTDELSDPSMREGFEQAVLVCLYRHEPVVRRVAQALAVLSAPAGPELIGLLLDIPPEFATQAVRALRTSGLVESFQLRHPRIIRSIVDDMPSEERRMLHRRAAEALHDQGCEPSVVAAHLLAACWTEPAWTAPVLQAAAAHALATGRPDIATSYLRLVGSAGAADSVRQLDTHAMLVCARWQINPLAADPHLAELVRAARDDGWSLPTILSTVPYLLWQGRVHEAFDAIAAVPSDAELDETTAARLHAARIMVSLQHPDRSAEVLESISDWRPNEVPTSTAARQLQALIALAAGLMPAVDHDILPAAEQLVRRYQADDGTAGVLATALAAVLIAGGSAQAATLADAVLSGTLVRNSPTWRAILHAVRAEAALRLGDLRLADHHARTALGEVAPLAWGVAIAAPLATLITCSTESGRFAEAERWLIHPVPKGALETPFGLVYLAARGRHLLAAECAHAARDDLHRCGEVMTAWGLDVAGLVPWRLELARVHLSLGDRLQGAHLLQEQLQISRGVDARTRGRALRLLATVTPLERRRGLLAEAVKLLQACGDRIELARALGDTGQALVRLGDSARGRQMVREAHQLAEECGASLLVQRLRRRDPSLGSTPPAVDASEQSDGLSEAERRVAVLAAQGETNRQISSKLYITVSTVEQHLTRVYRKLDVKRRSDLATRLRSVPQPV